MLEYKIGLQKLRDGLTKNLLEKTAMPKYIEQQKLINEITNLINTLASENLNQPIGKLIGEAINVYGNHVILRKIADKDLLSELNKHRERLNEVKKQNSFSSLPSINVKTFQNGDSVLYKGEIVVIESINVSKLEKHGSIFCYSPPLCTLVNNFGHVYYNVPIKDIESIKE